ncbi:MAG: hypothetical protein QF681_15690, partial [Vicinamibacterales bacterium]|nr:hypothetical protein [Vicinamibacterales bacterium]
MTPQPSPPAAPGNLPLEQGEGSTSSRSDTRWARVRGMASSPLGRVLILTVGFKLVVGVLGELRYDEQGYYRSGSSTFALSSNLTTTGAPIERF